MLFRDYHHLCLFRVLDLSRYLLITHIWYGTYTPWHIPRYALKLQVRY